MTAAGNGWRGEGQPREAAEERTLVMLVGMPLAGKSAFAAHMARLGWHVVAKAGRGLTATGAYYAAVARAFSEGRPRVLANADHLDPAVRRFVLALARARGYRAEAFVFVDADAARRRLHDLPRERQLPESEVEDLLRQHARTLKSIVTEGFDGIVSVREDDWPRS
jgi:predicted kinase